MTNCYGTTLAKTRRETSVSEYFQEKDLIIISGTVESKKVADFSIS